MSLLSNLWKTQKTPSYGGVQPYDHLTDAVGGSDYFKKITDRSNGIGVGYGDNYTSYANPQIANLRGTFNTRTVPELKSELTATGRRAGSSGFQQIQDAYNKEGLSENDIMAQLMQRNAEASHNDTNQGIADLGAFNANDYNARNHLADFQNNQYKQETANIQSDRNANNEKGANIVQGAVALAGIPFTGGASMYPSLAPSAYQSSVQGRTPNYSYLSQPSNYAKTASLYGQAGRVR